MEFSGWRPTILIMAASGTDTSARIAVTPETRDLVRSMKRGGETYDELLQKMIDQYEPDSDNAGD